MKRKIIVFVALLLPMLSHAQQVAYNLLDELDL